MSFSDGTHLGAPVPVGGWPTTDDSLEENTMGNQQVSASDLSLAAKEAEDYYGKIEGVQKGLYTQVETLMSGWQGSASRAFLVAFQEFDKEFSQVQNSLSDLHQKLGSTSLSYQQNEAEQTEAGQHMLQMIQNSGA